MVGTAAQGRDHVQPPMNTEIPRLPRHVAIIMDGNGRWAEKRSLPRAAGHEAGARAVRTVVETCREKGIGWLTLYAFSQENWARPQAEVSALMALLVKFLKDEKARMEKHDIRLRAIGRLERLPEASRIELGRVCNETAGHSSMNLTLALSYGGRDEILDACRALVKDGVPADGIDAAALSSRLYCPEMPDPDLLVRTSGEMRVSNFLLWQIAYSEIYVTDTLWPDFDKPEIEKALASYAGRQRRFGKTGAQIA
jgi:undecaprenyl diphosphate synthase